MFDFNDEKMVSLFNLADATIKAEEVSEWLKPEDHEEFDDLPDRELAIFLNGLIIDKRGRREGPQPEPENPLSNNMILRKMKIALNMKSEDMLAVFKLSDKAISKHELSAFFRNPSKDSYEPCMDQYLRNFFNGLQRKFRPKKSS